MGLVGGNDDRGVVVDIDMDDGRRGVAAAVGGDHVDGEVQRVFGAEDRVIQRPQQREGIGAAAIVEASSETVNTWLAAIAGSVPT